MKFPRIFSRNHADLIELEHLHADLERLRKYRDELKRENGRLKSENSDFLEIVLRRNKRIQELESRLLRVQSKRDDKGRFV